MHCRTHPGFIIPVLAVALATACSPDRIVTTPDASGSMASPVYSAGGVPNARQAAARDAARAPFTPLGQPLAMPYWLETPRRSPRRPLSFRRARRWLRSSKHACSRSPT